MPSFKQLSYIFTLKGAPPALAQARTQGSLNPVHARLCHDLRELGASAWPSSAFHFLTATPRTRTSKG